jgi:hypothetical protein
VSVHRERILAALQALRIEAPTSFTWLGEPGPTLPPEVGSAMDPQTALSYLRFTLQGHLYANFYTRGTAAPARGTQDLQPEVGWTPFVDSLSAANSGSGSRDPGWVVEREDEDGRIVVSREGLSLWAQPDDVAGASAEPGAQVSVRLPKELLRLSPGFYFALGNEEFAADEPVARMYWHLRSEASPRLIEQLTGSLNRAGLPFRLKVLKHPGSYLRCDAGVLYTQAADFARVRPLVARVHDELRPQLRPETPALTKPLGHGLGLAEEPPSGESFGMNRCGLLAEGAVRAWELGLTDAAERLGVVEATFAEAGISLDTPFLNAGSPDVYE